MAASPASLDVSPLAVAVAVAGGIVGPQLAYYVGAYSLILLGWFAGLLYGLYARSVDAKMPIWAYSACTFIVSLCATVPASEWIGRHSPFPFEWTALLFPVSALIPAFPDKWATLARRLMSNWVRETKEKRP